VCGICGIVYKEAQQYRNIIPKMLKAILHRGPDENGKWFFDNCALGHTRLSIVDIKSGQQPMVKRNLGLVFNGEIYGYKELRKGLLKRGISFETNSDTEVILAMYQCHGQRMMSYLPGMFAFAVWDDESQTLFCARDRFGEKPFYYAWGKNGEFIFASEIKAILASDLVEPVLDDGQLWHYMNYSYIYPTRTIYRNIHTLPPAHTLVLKNGIVEIERYWHLPGTNTDITEHEAIDEFKRLFKKAVERQLVADVPVAAFLSGGLDSGSVVAVAAQLVPQLTTISFAFREGIDESYTARTMAERYNTNHIEIRDIDFDMSEMLEKMQQIFDEPFADPAVIPAYLISKEARKYAKVVLTGDAGDELLGGYDRRYRALLYMQRYQKSEIPSFIRNDFLHCKRFINRLIRKIKKCAGSSKTYPLTIERALRNTDIKLQAMTMLCDDTKDIVGYARKKGQMLSEYLQREIGLLSPKDDYRIYDGFLETEALDNALRVDLQDYLPGNGFLKTDRTTMSVSLESRTPFCDKDLAEFCVSLPFSMKVNYDQDKYILRKAMGDMWTEPVRLGVKNGFSPPFDKWLQENKVREMEEYYLKCKGRKLFQVLSYDGVQKLINSKKYVWPEWSLLMLSMWMEKHPCNFES
jgi:asparagine synthase (glutamine-hydrolysing)